MSTPTERRALADRLCEHADGIDASRGVATYAGEAMREAAAALREPVIAVTPERRDALDAAAEAHHDIWWHEGDGYQRGADIRAERLRDMLAEAREASHE